MKNKDAEISLENCRFFGMTPPEICTYNILLLPTVDEARGDFFVIPSSSSPPVSFSSFSVVRDKKGREWREREAERILKRGGMTYCAPGRGVLLEEEEKRRRTKEDSVASSSDVWRREGGREGQDGKDTGDEKNRPSPISQYWKRYFVRQRGGKRQFSYIKSSPQISIANFPSFPLAGDAPRAEEEDGAGYKAILLVLPTFGKAMMMISIGMEERCLDEGVGDPLPTLSPPPLPPGPFCHSMPPSGRDSPRPNAIRLDRELSPREKMLNFRTKEIFCPFDAVFDRRRELSLGRGGNTRNRTAFVVVVVQVGGGGGSGGYQYYHLRAI